MPMTSEQAVIGGRETYGEPKKIAKIDFEKDSERVAASVSRMGGTYLEAKGTLGEPLGPREFVEYGFCVKALPSCEKTRGFDGDPLLVRMEQVRKPERVENVEGELILRDLAGCPVVDLPVRETVSIQWVRRSSDNKPKVVGPVDPVAFARHVPIRYH